MADQGELESQNERKGLLSDKQSTASNGVFSTNLSCLRLTVTLLLLGLPVSLITIGALKINKCPIEPMIPIYLIISGATGILTVLLTFISTISKQRCWYGLVFLTSLFALCWFVAGNIWVFKNYKKRSYCDEKAYYLAFWFIVLTYIFSVLSCCCAPIVGKQNVK
ncbi:transmembrane protein 272 isoform X2 [Hydra vulgaris]|uniref:Transmembrane protein 272 isoform X2 n=1 Tax=Hydra vulgaris TaxID=6087 RepID=A0ABM4B844_HYDVU